MSVSGCGGNGGSSAPSSPAPFDSAKGEGDLVSNQLVVTYPTATTTQTGLDTVYTQAICPDTVGPQDCTTNENSLNTPAFGNFNVSADPIANNPLGIKLVDAIKIDYTALNVDQSAVTVSGGILVPELAAKSLKGMILYFHPTTVQRTKVPSNFVTATNADPNFEGILFAAVWASQGYVVVMPDYVGLGDDTTHVHPYVVYPAQNAQSGLAMVKAARSALASTYDITGRLPLYVTGYSEGGAYALEAAHLMQNNSRYASTLKVKLKIDAPMSGFYDVSDTGLSYLFDNITATNNNWFSLNPVLSAISKPYLFADVALSFANYSGIAPTDILAGMFYTCSAGYPNDPCGASGNLDGLYYTATQTPHWGETVVSIAVSQAVNTGWGPLSNAITPLLTSTYAEALMSKDQSNPLYQQILASDTYLFVPKFPVTLVSLMEDSIVTRKNSDVAFAYFTQQNPSGPYHEDLVDNNNFLVFSALSGSTGPVDHSTQLPFLSVLVLNQFNTTP